MTIFETLGFIWIVLTASLGAISLFYLAYVGLKAMINRGVELPIEVKKMFRIAR